MFARKLGRRLAGLALVLAAAIGGVSAASAAYAAGGPAESTPVSFTQQDFIWV
jgi:hypothetical protein